MLILIGKTASGKDTIAKKLINDYGYNRIVTYTSRPMREGEQDGVDYHFVSVDDFKSKIEQGFFMEYKTYHVADGSTWFYGVSKESIEKSDKYSVVILTVDGYIDFLSQYHNIIPHKAFYISANEKIIRQRLKSRGDNKEEAARRIQHDNIDFKFTDMFIKTIYNNGNSEEELIDLIEKGMNIKKPKKKNIYIDLDCTLFDTISQIVKMYSEDFGYYANYKPVKAEDIKTWDFTELECANKDCIDRYFNQARFFSGVEMFDNAKEVIDILSEKYNIIFCSTGYATNLRAKNDWTKKNFPYSKFIGINLKDNKDKSKVKMSGEIMIDDRADNLATSNADIKICFGKDYEWNKDFDDSLVNHFRVDNWNKILEILG